MSDISTEVRRRALDRCEYCLIPQSAFRRAFHIEHVIAKQHGGEYILENLALACWQCNLKKGPNLTGVDPETGDLSRLFNPRTDTWTEHFTFIRPKHSLKRIEIRGLTPVGRTTSRLLDMNQEFRQALRFEIFTSEAV